MTSSPAAPKIKLSNGKFMPMFGLGTYEATVSGDVAKAVKIAISNGYRHIDTAYFYLNEKEIGNAIREKIEDGTVKREDLFITTKLWNNTHAEDKVVPACRKSLENLGLNYVDLYLIHWPMGLKEGDDLRPMDENGHYLFSDIDYLETWRGMEECVRLGLAHSIGLSNFNSQQITRVMESATIKPVNNQVEVNINLNQRPLIACCKEKNITVTGYSPLARPGNNLGIATSLDNSKLLAIAEKYQKTPAQVALRYVFQIGAIPIPKSVTESRIKENINIFNFELTPEEMTVIDSLGNGQRLGAAILSKDHKYYPFNIPF